MARPWPSLGRAMANPYISHWRLRQKPTWLKSYDLALDWVRKVDPTIFIDLESAAKPAPKVAPKPKPAPKAKVKKNDE